MIELFVLGFIVAAIVGTVGFLGLGDTTAVVGRTVFFVAILLFLISAVVGVARGRLKA